MAFNDDLQAEAKSLGFNLVGVSSTEPTESFAIFQQWLDKGLNASMRYLSSNRSKVARANPNVVLKGAHSIILLGMRYLPSQYPLNKYGKNELRGRVASYAWGTDYHILIPPLLEKLSNWIKRNTQLPSQFTAWRGYTDTGPVLERELGQRAGLGFFGKNSNLINQKYGSYFFLAEIFLTLEMQQTHAIYQDRCGDCTRCIDACPTKCILPNRTIDARRCISYLTIENKADIPFDLRPLLGQWVFGCDICQIVCPWNKKLLKNEGSLDIPIDYQPSPTIAQPSLIEDLSITHQEFNQKFMNSAIKRAHRRGYLRNIAVALGNLKLPELDNYLIKSLREEVEPLVRGHVAWALANCGTQKDRRELDKAMKRETDAYVKYEIEKAQKYL